MAYNIKFEPKFLKQLSKLDNRIQRKILEYIDDVVAKLDDPRKLGKMLTGEMNGLYRYRVGDYRIICRIIDQKITVVMVSVGHRKGVYPSFARSSPKRR